MNGSFNPYRLFERIRYPLLSLGAAGLLVMLIITSLEMQVSVSAAPPAQTLDDLCSLFPALPKPEKLDPGSDRSQKCQASYYPEPKCPQVNHATIIITKYASPDEAKNKNKVDLSQYKPTSVYGDSGNEYDGGQSAPCPTDPSQGSTSPWGWGYQLNFTCGNYLVNVSDLGFHIDDIKAVAKEVDKNLKTLNACSGAQEPEPPIAEDKKFSILNTSCLTTAKDTGKAGKIYCEVYSINAPTDDPNTYEWTVDGKPVPPSQISKNTMWMDGLTKGDHVFTVKAKNNGQETDVLSVTHTLYEGVEGAPLAPQAPPQPGGQQRGQLITPSGATPLDPGQITSLALNPGEEAKVNLTESDGKNSNQVFSLRNPSDKLTLFDIQLILPGAIFENGSGTSKMAVLSKKPPAYTFLPVAAGGDVRLNVDLNQGALRVEIYRIQMDTVQVTTNVSVVIAGGKNVLGVTHDPTTGEDKVSSFIGRIEVKPLAPGVSSFYISTGEMVQVSASGAGQISTIPLNQNPELRTYGLYVIGGCGCLGILLIVGIIVLTRVTRAKKSKLPPQKPPHQVDVNPYAPAFGLPPTAMSTGGGTSTVSAAGRLIVSHGSASLPWVNIPPGGSIIGSDADCGLVVSDPTVSAHHTRVDFVNNVWVITDLNSSSGTWVNGVRISQQALRPGDQIKIGQTELGFQ